MLSEYSHTKSKSLAQMCTAMAEIQHFFLRDCFFIGTPCVWCHTMLQDWQCSSDN